MNALNVRHNLYDRLENDVLLSQRLKIFVFNRTTIYTLRYCNDSHIKHSKFRSWKSNEIDNEKQ